MSAFAHLRSYVSTAYNEGEFRKSPVRRGRRVGVGVEGGGRGGGEGGHARGSCEAGSGVDKISEIIAGREAAVNGGGRSFARGGSGHSAGLPPGRPEPHESYEIAGGRVVYEIPGGWSR